MACQLLNLCGRTIYLVGDFVFNPSQVQIPYEPAAGSDPRVKLLTSNAVWGHLVKKKIL